MGKRKRTVENMVESMLDFYRDKSVLVTGHTGFKGAWLCTILTMAGARVTGFALPPAEGPNLYDLANIAEKVDSRLGDIRDLATLRAAFDAAQPELVFHLAAQPIVREGYRDPVGTYGTNVMGTVHLLECVRQSGSVQSVVNITTDKVYLNSGRSEGYREDDILNGSDPYANSKSCSELVTASYRKSFFADRPTAISTARAGNVIGGGDFAKDRIIPDCVRAAQSGRPIRLRNPRSVRPYQHVLEALSAYLLLAERQCSDRGVADCYNVGPDDGDCVTTGELAEMFCRAWGQGMRWENVGNAGEPHEDGVLRLDCAKIRSRLGWHARWHVEQAVEETVAWTQEWLNGGDLTKCMERQVLKYFREG